MKRIALIALCLMIVTGAWAQKKNVTTALLELKKTQPDMQKVQSYLEAASQDPSTKDYHKTWFALSKMYMYMLDKPKYKDEQPAAKATEALLKLIDLDPKYEKQQVTYWLIVAANGSYNSSRTYFDNKDYKTSGELAQKAIDIYNVEEGKRFEGNKGIDTSRSAAQQIVAYSAFYGKDYDKAIIALEAFLADPIYNRPNDYSMLSSAYKESGDNTKAIATLDKGRAAYPNDKQLRIDEINYYISTGQQDVFIKKLQDAIAADPENADLHFFLAQSFYDMANPTDKNGNALDRPANYEELMNDAEESYNKAMSLAPDNITYLYNFAVYYFNQSVPLNKAMNALGQGPENDKKYEALNNEVKDLYAKAMPIFQKIYDILEPKHTTLNAEDKSTLISTITVMREIHARNNNADESKAMKEKLDEVKGK